jgi:hypothetical protein
MPAILIKHLTALALFSAPALAQTLTVSLRAVAQLPSSTTDQAGAPFTITGLSGLTRRTGDEYLAVMDNSNKIVRLGITVNADGSIAAVTVLGGLSLAHTRDFEGIALADSAATSVLLAEEGTPAIHEYSLVDGAFIRTFTPPAIFATRRDNFGFESLTRHALTGRVLTANEEALIPDGSVSSTSSGTTVRLLRLAGPNLTAESQTALVTQPLHGSVITGARSGLCDLVWLPSGRVLGLERSFAFNLSGLFQTRIYELDWSGASDVSALSGLNNQSFTAVTKRLLYQGNLNNLEGLCLGPRLAGGDFSLLGIVDDGDPVSTNALAAFVLSGGPGTIACPADVNDDSLLSVQDLFDFLAAFFANDSAADVNGSDTITVQDLFDFLSIYFVGCQ